MDHDITLPGTVGQGVTILVVGAFDPSGHAISLRLLNQHGTTTDEAPVVTTLASVDETIETWNAVSEKGERPSIGVIDTTSESQSIAATYGDVPTVFTPSSGDLERIVMALSELSGEARPSDGARHLVVRSLTPILQEASTERVCRVLERIGGLRTETGYGLFGVDSSMHDPGTLTALADTVDCVVRIDQRDDGQFDSTFHPNRRHVPF